jgi:hypothetical protein
MQQKECPTFYTPHLFQKLHQCPGHSSMSIMCGVQEALECGVGEIYGIRLSSSSLKKQLLYYGRAHFKHSHIQIVAIFTKRLLPIFV